MLVMCCLLVGWSRVSWSVFGVKNIYLNQLYDDFYSITSSYYIFRDGIVDLRLNYVYIFFLCIYYHCFFLSLILLRVLRLL